MSLEKHEFVMQKAVDFLHQAEDTDDFRERQSLRELAGTYVAMARELRLGKNKSRTYTGVRVERPATAPPLDPEKSPSNEDEDDVTS